MKIPKARYKPEPKSPVPHDTKSLDAGQLELMWSMLQVGHQKSNIPALEEHLDLLRQAMLQKTAGQKPYAKVGDVDVASDLGTIINCIVIESMCLYLSGDLDKLNKLLAEEMP